MNSLILTWLIVPLINAWFDRKRPKRNYLQVNLLRGIALIAHGAFVMDMQGGYLVFDYNALRNWAIVLFYFTSYWIVFELALNLLWGENLLYYDQKEGDSGWIDRIFKGRPVLHALAKAVALIIAVITFTLM